MKLGPGSSWEQGQVVPSKSTAGQILLFPSGTCENGWMVSQLNVFPQNILVSSCFIICKYHNLKTLIEINPVWSDTARKLFDQQKRIKCHISPLKTKQVALEHKDHPIGPVPKVAVESKGSK